MNIVFLNKLIAKAEKFEQRARERLDQKAENVNCSFEYGSMNCTGCKKHATCESTALVFQGETNSLFERAWQGYQKVEQLARAYVIETDSVESFMLLAQVLMDIHIHPNSGFKRDTKALWEAQYLWLHLYYRTGEQAYFEQAKFCDAIRHASVKEIQK